MAQRRSELRVRIAPLINLAALERCVLFSRSAQTREQSDTTWFSASLGHLPTPADARPTIANAVWLRVSDDEWRLDTAQVPSRCVPRTSEFGDGRAQQVQSRIGAKERKGAEDGASRKAVSRRATRGRAESWPMAPIRAERRAIIWVRGRRSRS